MNTEEELFGSQENIDINIKQLFYFIKSKLFLITAVFLLVLTLFTVLTFILPKKYTVSADLYINKSNYTNLHEFNPYVLSEGNELSGTMGVSNNAMNNEIELMKSSLVINNVIKNNNIRIKNKKKYFFFPNPKYGEYISVKSFLKKNITVENKKGTNVITITYKNKNPELAYNVVNSIIVNYITLQKDINSEKSKSDKKIIEKQYNEAKKLMSAKLNSSAGIPNGSISMPGNVSAMSAFSISAQKAMGNVIGQYKQGEKSKIAISEEVSKVSELSKKLEWAKIVEEMSDNSKVLIINEPLKPRDFEYSSPKLLINIIIGTVLGLIIALILAFTTELTSKKTSYLMLDENIIFNLSKDILLLKSLIVSNSNKKICCVTFQDLSEQQRQTLGKSGITQVIKADITFEFKNRIQDTDNVIFLLNIKQTDKDLYKFIKQIVKDANKTILTEVLL